MSYQPKVGDTVRIRNYMGFLHPLTIWVVKETRPDLSLIAVPTQGSRIGMVQFTNDHWIDNSQLIKVLTPFNDKDVMSA